MLFLNLFFNIFNVLSSFIRGSIGLVSYPICIFFIVVGLLKMFDVSIKVSKKSILLIILWLIGFISILHIPTSIYSKTLSEYLLLSFKSGYTAGGSLFSLIVYPIELLIGNVGAYIFFAIYLIIVSAVSIDKIHSYYTYSNFIKSSPIKEIREDKDEEQDVDTEYEEEPDDLLDDEEYDTMPSGEVEIIDDIDDDEEFTRKSKAKEILNLNNNPNLYENKDKLDKNDVFTSFNDDIEDEIEDTTEEIEEDIEAYRPSRTIGEFESKAGRKVVLHGVNDEPIFSQEDISHPKPNTDYKEALASVQKQKEAIDKKKAALDYLQITKGNFVRTSSPTTDTVIDNVSAPKRHSTINNVKEPERKAPISNISRSNNDASTYIQNHTTKVTKNEDKPFDIYDEGLTKDTFTRNADKYRGVVDKFGDATEAITKKQDDIPIFEPRKVGNGVQIDISEIPKRPQVEQGLPPKPTPPKPYKYTPPPIELLDETVETNDSEVANSEIVAQKIIDTYASFQLDTSLVGYSIGPTFTRYELQLNTRGRTISTVSNYAQDLCYELGVQNVRMEVPIPGRNAFGVEVPNKNRVKVNLRSLIESPKFKNSKSPLTAAIGKDISGECVTVQINKLIHTLMAGTSGSGKSVCLNVLLASLLYKASPEDVRLLIIDPKMVEFSMFTNLPHMLVPKTIVDLTHALQALDWVIKEMERRYKKFEENYVKNLEEFNECKKVKSYEEAKMYYIIVIFDEVADYMSQARKEIDDKIKRLAAKARAAGIHLILATQRPTTDVITGTIKANMSSRMALTVKTAIDSRTILDDTGAECLLGYGDMILAAYGANKVRLQCGFISNEELANILEFIRENNEARFDPAIEEEMFNPDDGNSGGFNSSDPNSMDIDPLMKDCLKFALRINRVSASSIQANFSIGFPRASKIVAQMEKLGYAGKSGGKSILLITEQEFEEKFGEGLND